MGLVHTNRITHSTIQQCQVMPWWARALHITLTRSATYNLHMTQQVPHPLTNQQLAIFMWHSPTDSQASTRNSQTLQGSNQNHSLHPAALVPPFHGQTHTPRPTQLAGLELLRGQWVGLQGIRHGKHAHITFATACVTGHNQMHAVGQQIQLITPLPQSMHWRRPRPHHRWVLLPQCTPPCSQTGKLLLHHQPCGVQ